MTAQHTPAPWIWGPNARRYADPNLPECQRVMNVHLGKTTALCWDERDARLIAAAPDLLAALREIVAAVESGDVDGYSPSGDWFREARAAIAKTIGGAA